MKPEYYKPGQIYYSEPQVLWLLKNVLFHDEWPSDHMETGYTGEGKQRGHNAPFVTLREIIGELNARLRLCGKAGLYLEYITLIDYEDPEHLIARLAGYHSTTPKEVSYLTNMALRYCCGRKRKQVTFDMFCRYTKSRDNKNIRSIK